MLKQASIRQIQKSELTREQGYLVATMAFYPRGLKKELLDEYRAELAPDRELFKEFKEQQAKVGHEAAFEKSRYEERFHLGRRATETLKNLARMSQTQDVYLACQCEIGERCHREILLLIAEKEFGAKVDPLFHTYPVFEKRLKEALGESLKSR
ncbi:MAG: DUF488 family protein [Pseudobdellovibrionaceae bacterium]